MAEIKILHEMTLGYPVEDVFARLSEIDREPEWQANLVRVWHDPEGPVGLGTKIVRERKVRGSMNRQLGVVTVFEPPTQMEVREQEGSGQQPFRITYRLAPAGDDRTKLTFTLALEGIPRVVASVVQRKLDGEIGGQFERFDRLLAERRPAP